MDCGADDSWFDAARDGHARGRPNRNSAVFLPATRPLPAWHSMRLVIPTAPRLWAAPMPSLRYGVSVTPATGGGWTATFLKDFGYGQGGPTGLILDADGNLCFGTAGGGASGGGLGTVFKLTPGANGVWTEKVLHSFGSNSTDGTHPLGNLIFDAAGNL